MKIALINIILFLSLSSNAIEFKIVGACSSDELFNTNIKEEYKILGYEKRIVRIRENRAI